MYKCMLYVKNFEIELSLLSAMRIIDGLRLYTPETKFIVRPNDTNCGDLFISDAVFFQYKDIKKITITEVINNEHND